MDLNSIGDKRETSLATRITLLFWHSFSPECEFWAPKQHRSPCSKKSSAMASTVTSVPAHRVLLVIWEPVHKPWHIYYKYITTAGLYTRLSVNLSGQTADFVWSRLFPRLMRSADRISAGKWWRFTRVESCPWEEEVYFCYQMRDQSRRIVITSAVIRGTGRGWLIRICGLLADAWNKSLNTEQHRLLPFISPSLILVFMVIYGFFFLICLICSAIWRMWFKLVIFPHLGLNHICSFMSIHFAS